MTRPANDGRHAEATFKDCSFGSFANGVMPPSGQVNTSAPLSVVKMTIVLSVVADVLDVLHDLADVVIHLRHAGFSSDIVIVRCVHIAWYFGGR